jgi:protein ATS1
LKGLISEDDPMEKVFGGVGHFIALGKSAYGFGNGTKGQFGATTDGRLLAENIEQVACGKDFSCIVSSDDEITVLTTTTKHNIAATPTVDGVKSIAASWSTIAVLTSSGTITSWGRSDRGQYPPSNIPAISLLAAGSEHFLALSHTHKVYAWGWNEHGNCARQDRSDITSLHEIPFPRDEKPTYIAGGCGTSWIWTEKV